jgi:hypothetical protein
VKRLFAAVAVAGVVWLTPMSAEATKKPPTTTTSTTSTSTTSTTTSTTVPPTTTPPTWTVPEGCVAGEFDIVCTTVPPETTTPSTPPPAGCVPGEYPQGPTGDEPCGPTDLCSGDGKTRNWSLLPCDTTTTTVVGPPPVLPATGGETGWIALGALVTLLTGVSIVGTVRRSS